MAGAPARQAHQLGQREHLRAGRLEHAGRGDTALDAGPQRLRDVAHPHRLHARVRAGQRHQRQQGLHAREQVEELVFGTEHHRRPQHRERHAAVAQRGLARRLAAQIVRRRVGIGAQRADVHHVRHAGVARGAPDAARQLAVHAIEFRRAAVQDAHQVDHRIGAGQQARQRQFVVHVGSHEVHAGQRAQVGAVRQRARGQRQLDRQAVRRAAPREGPADEAGAAEHDHATRHCLILVSRVSGSAPARLSCRSRTRP